MSCNTLQSCFAHIIRSCILPSLSINYLLSAHGLLPHMGCYHTWAATTHGLLPHMGCYHTWAAIIHGLLPHLVRQDNLHTGVYLPRPPLTAYLDHLTLAEYLRKQSAPPQAPAQCHKLETCNYHSPIHCQLTLVKLEQQRTREDVSTCLQNMLNVVWKPSSRPPRPTLSPQIAVSVATSFSVAPSLLTVHVLLLRTIDLMAGGLADNLVYPRSS